MVTLLLLDAVPRTDCTNGWPPNTLPCCWAWPMPRPKLIVLKPSASRAVRRLGLFAGSAGQPTDALPGHGRSERHTQGSETVAALIRNWMTQNAVNDVSALGLGRVGAGLRGGGARCLRTVVGCRPGLSGLARCYGHLDVPDKSNRSPPPMWFIPIGRWSPTRHGKK